MNTITTNMPPIRAEGAQSGGATGTREAAPVQRQEQDSRPVNVSQDQELVSMIQNHLDRMNIKISFSTYGENSERTAVIVKERETGEIIREIPPKELQNLHVKMEELLGMIFNGSA